jgi:hypothetical protein
MVSVKRCSIAEWLEKISHISMGTPLSDRAPQRLSTEIGKFFWKNRNYAALAKQRT